MKKRTTLLVALSGTVLATVAFATISSRYQASDPYQVRSGQFNAVSGATKEQQDELLFDWLRGDTPDPMWVQSEDYSVEAARTNLIHAQTGANLHVITIVDEIADLVTAEIYLDGVLKDSATQGNGITDNGDGTATAILNVWKPRTGEHGYRLTWSDGFGVPKTHTLGN